MRRISYILLVALSLSTRIYAQGVQSSSDNVVITNSGQITTTDSDADGIFNDNDFSNVHIINSGTIRSTQGFALNLQGTASQTLSLLRGSNLDGGVHVETVDLDLNVETGLNLALTLDPTSTAGFGTLGIDAPFVILGNTIAVIDPTGLAMQADVVADLSDTLLNGIYHQRAPCGCGVWAQGIGSYRKRGDNAHTVGHDNWQGGYASLFGGISYGEAEVDEHTQKATTRSYVGGNRVNSELQGLPLKFDPGSPRNLVGFRGIQSFGCFNLSLNVEGSFDNYRSSRVLSELTLNYAYYREKA